MGLDGPYRHRVDEQPRLVRGRLPFEFDDNDLTDKLRTALLAVGSPQERLESSAEVYE